MLLCGKERANISVRELIQISMPTPDFIISRAVKENMMLILNT